MRWILAVLALALLVAPAWTRADDQSLGAIAEKTKREREARRAKGTKPAKAYTNDDLPNAGAAAPETAETESAKTPTEGAAKDKDAKAAEGAKAEKTDDQIRAEKRDEIQKKIDEQRQEIAEIDRRVADAQRELSDITNYTYGARRASLQKVVDDGNADKAKAQQAIEALQEEARRLGVPVS